jgi:hypothetical protein
MTTRDRQTLYSFFQEGEMPSPDHFGDLIDSMVNMRDEGFHKTALNGLKISTPVGKYDTLISFYREASFSLDQDAGTPLWQLRYGTAPGFALQFQLGSGSVAPPVLSLHAASRVGINTAEPAHELDVDGVVAARGRVGTYPVPDRASIVADGGWHPVTDWLEGCNGFDVVASAGRLGSGRHALMHALALNAYNPRRRWFEFLFGERKPIRCHNAWYGQRCEKLELQWWADPKLPRRYQLQIRSRCHYYEEPGAQPVPIEVHLTQLWLEGTAAAPSGAPAQEPRL